jgi:hypothetical protein
MRSVSRSTAGRIRCEYSRLLPNVRGHEKVRLVASSRSPLAAK